MPVTPEYNWEETSAGLTVKVKLKGFKRADLDTTCTACLLKVNCPPYLLSIDLDGEIDVAKSAAVVDASGVTFNCIKMHSGIWGKLKIEGEKAVIKERREKSVEDERVRLQELAEAKKKLKQNAEKAGVDGQWAKENLERDTIEKRKEAELQAERDDIEKWKHKMDARKKRAQQKVVTKVGGVEIFSDDESDDEDEGERLPEELRLPEDEKENSSEANPPQPPSSTASKAENFVPPKPPAAVEEEEEEEEEADEDPTVKTERNIQDMWSIYDDSNWDEIEAELDRRDAAKAKADEAAKARAPTMVRVEDVVPQRAIPPPRRLAEGAKVPVDFTRLQTDHLPARETREKEIELLKRKAKMDKEAAQEAADVAEREPIFLKDKGDGFYRVGDLKAAVNAYNKALELQPEFVRCLANRAACYLALNELPACVDDCSAALELMLTQSEDAAAREGGRVSRPRLLARRGRARAQLGAVTDALEDYTLALKLDPDNEQLRKDTEELQACVQPLDVAGLRKRGDTRFKEKDYLGALEAYSLIIQMPAAQAEHADKLAAYSNRGACHLCQSEFGKAVDDSDKALGLLLQPAGYSLHQMGQFVPALLDSAAADFLRPDEGQEAEARADGAGGGEAEAELVAQWKQGGKGRGSLARLLARRATSLGHLKKYAEAAEDYSYAAALQQDAGNHAVADQLAADMKTVLALQKEAQ